MRHAKLFSLLSVLSLALFAAGCGGGNSIGHTTQTITFDNPGTQTVGAPLTLSATANSGLAVSFTTRTPSVCTVSGRQPHLGPPEPAPSTRARPATAPMQWHRR